MLKINFKNAANTFISFLTNTNTAARTYTFQNRDGTIADDTDLAGKVAGNTAITGATKTKITYDAKGLVTAGADATTSDIAEGSNLYFTDERTQDAVGLMIDSTLTYVDATPLLQRAALTGDVTASAGSNATTIGAGTVTLSKQANVATSTVFYRKTAGTGSPEVQTLATLKTDLGLTGTNTGDSVTLLYADGSVPGGNTIANTTTETAFASTFTIPANSLAVGDVIRVRIAGRYSTDVIAPLIRGKVKIGTAVVSDSGSVTSVAGATNAGWHANAEYIVTAIGAGGTLECHSDLSFATAAAAALSIEDSRGSVSLDTTADRAMTVRSAGANLAATGHSCNKAPNEAGL